MGRASRESGWPQAVAFFLPGPCHGRSCTFFFFSQNDFALTSTEKSIHKESETKETRGEEEQDTEVLEVFQPTQEWQTLQPGIRPALVL